MTFQIFKKFMLMGIFFLISTVSIHAQEPNMQALIGQNPVQNGQRYYLDVMQNYEKALKLNPENQLAKQLQQKFFEGMKKQTGL